MNVSGTSSNTHGAHDRIPNFIGREIAAERLAARPEWRNAAVVKANPDKAQLPVRLRALQEGKRVHVAVPRMRSIKPFVLLDPLRLSGSIEDAVTSEGAVLAGQLVAVHEMEPIDLAVCGTVAVNRQGARLGKGGGFSDLEIALLVEAGVIRPDTPIVTTVHDEQVLNEEIPETDHDFRVDLITTPRETIDVPGLHPRPGIIWDHLEQAKIEAIPILATSTSRPSPDVGAIGL